MATHDQLTAYRANPAKVREADEGWSGTLDGETYAEIERLFALLDRTDPSELMGSELLARMYRAARPCGAAQTAELHKLIQADEDARELDRLEQMGEAA
jgi:hypothetical protein